MRGELGREWTAGALLTFALPTMAMMLFMGLYTVVDTIFVARLVGTDALSAINIVCPVVNVTVGLGTMLATGGNAILSRKLGAGHLQAARQDLTLLVLAGVGVGLLLLGGGLLFLDPLLRALGASPRLYPYCRDYLLTLLFFSPASLLQTLFSNLFPTAGRPGLGLGLSLLAGGANIVFDYVFIACCGLGIRGAALGTGLGYLIPGMAGLFFFAGNRGPLTFARPCRDWGVLVESCLNGSSELVGQLASALTTFLFNGAMMSLLGEDGVAAITILIYAQFLLSTLFLGYSMGVAPVIGYHYGSGDRAGLGRVLRISLAFLGASSLAVFLTARLGGGAIVGLFAAQSSPVYPIAVGGFAVFSYSFLFSGLNGFTSAFFTALSNGRVSAALSALRTFGLIAGGILLLPRIMGLPGVWLAVPLAEGIMAAVSVGCLLRYRRQYGY